MKVTLGTLSALALLTSALHAATVTLDFNSLPSAQGWTYVSDGKPEAAAFSVAGGILSMDSSGANITYYLLPGRLLDPTLPFTITTRARVLTGSGEWLHFYAETPTHIAAIGLGLDHIVSFSGSNFVTLATGLDNTQFHDIRIEGIPNVSADVFLDNMLIGTVPFGPYDVDTGHIFGDGGGTGSGRAEITSYRIVQRLGPTVSAAVSCVDVCWDSLSNRQYQVQYRSDFTTNQWRDLGSPLQGSGSTNCITDPVRGEPRRFYRVVEGR